MSDLETRIEAALKSREVETTLVLESFSVVIEKPIEWLWEQKLPRFVLIVFSGLPDCGKTTVAIDIIARYSTARDWPDGAKNPNPAGEALMLIAEDDLSRTVKPRLLAAGADVTKVHYLKMVELRKGATKIERSLALDQDLAKLRETLEKRPEIKLIVADPITGYLGRANMNKEQELRAVLEPLRKLCEELQVTFIALGHFNKRTDVVALQRISGAAALTGVPRAVWAFGVDPAVKGEYLMLLAKGNFAKDRSGMRFAIVEKQVDAIGGHPVIEWKGKSEKTTEDLVERKDPELRKKDKAVVFLQKALKGGPRLADELIAEASDEGIGEKTLWKAKKIAGVRSKRERGKWYWHLEPRASETRLPEPQSEELPF